MTNDLSHADRKLPPIFIYSGFRASSTWLWLKFRESENLRCYYEVFNEELATIDLQKIFLAQPSSWRSRHPKSAPYFLEFSSLLSSTSGVNLFPRDPKLGSRWIGSDGIKANLDKEVKDYIEYLIISSQAEDLRPVVTCTRMLGLSSGMREAFGGYHILLIRNLFRQWNSFSGQHKSGNDIFVYNLFKTLNLRECDPYIEYLSLIFSKEEIEEFDVWIREDNYDRIFCYFVSLHIYLYLSAKNLCDIIIFVSKIEGDDFYRANLENKIRMDTGVVVNFSDVEDAIDYPKYSIRNRQACEILINELVGKLKTEVGCDYDGKFVEELISDLWDDHGKFEFYNKSASRIITSISSELELCTIQLHQMEHNFDEKCRSFNDSEAALRDSEKLKADLESLYEKCNRDLIVKENELKSTYDEISKCENVIEDLSQSVLTLKQDIIILQEGYRIKCDDISELTEKNAAYREKMAQINIERFRLFSQLRIKDGPPELRFSLAIARTINKCNRLFRYFVNSIKK